MRNRIAVQLFCALALMAAPLLAQEASPPATAPVETTAPAPEITPVQVTGTVSALGDSLLELNVEHVIGGSPEVTSALEGTTIALTLDAASEKPAELKPADRVELWFKEAEGRRIVTRIVLAPPPVAAAAVASTANDVAAPVAPAPEQVAPAAEPSAPPPAEARSPEPATAPAPAAVVRTKKAASQPNPVANLPTQSEKAPEASNVAATTDEVTVRPDALASPASPPPSSSPAADLRLLEPVTPPEPSDNSKVEISTSSGSQGPLLLAIGLAAVSAALVLGFTLKRKEAVVGLDLAPVRQRR